MYLVAPQRRLPTGKSKQADEEDKKWDLVFNIILNLNNVDVAHILLAQDVCSVVCLQDACILKVESSSVVTLNCFYTKGFG